MVSKRPSPIPFMALRPELEEETEAKASGRDILDIEFRDALFILTIAPTGYSSFL